MLLQKACLYKMASSTLLKSSPGQNGAAKARAADRRLGFMESGAHHQAAPNSSSTAQCPEPQRQKSPQLCAVRVFVRRSKARMNDVSNMLLVSPLLHQQGDHTMTASLAVPRTFFTTGYEGLEFTPHSPGPLTPRSMRTKPCSPHCGPHEFLIFQ